MLNYLMKIMQSIDTLNRNDNMFNKLKIKLPRFLAFEVTIKLQTLVLSIILLIFIPDFVELNDPPPNLIE